MTNLMTTNFTPAMLTSAAPNVFSLPVAPLKMPLQVLEPESGILQLLAAPFVACAGLLRHGFRRAN